MVKPFFFVEVTVFLSYLSGLSTVVSAHCSTSVQGAVLQNHAYKSLVSNGLQDCYYMCRNDVPCQSINFYKDTKTCELNNRTANEQNPLKFVENYKRVFFFENPFRVPLGSLDRIPALSCQEIKETLTGALSRTYWIREAGKTINVYCNMTIGAREGCTGNPCINGGMCNYEGSGHYTCSCPPEYKGVHCESQVVECHAYKNLSSEDRNENFLLKDKPMCDCNASISGWHRFTGGAGNKMPTHCVPMKRCNTHAPGWLDGSLPSPSEGIAKRIVCFHWKNNCCHWTANISVKNCGGFYVYYLVKPPTYYLRYCGAS